MRKVFLATVIYGLISILNANAQQFESGLRLGINASQINGDGMGGFNKLGAVGGLFVSYPFSEKLKGQFEILYSGKGSKRVITPDFVGPGYWDELTLHYIDVPVMAKYNVFKKLILNAGFGGAYLFNHKIEYGNVDVKKYDFYGLIGAGYKISPKFEIFANYTNSLLSIDNSNNLTVFHLGGMYNLVASFGIYYNFTPGESK